MLEYLTPHLHARDKVIVTPVALNSGWWSSGLPDDAGMVQLRIVRHGTGVTGDREGRNPPLIDVPPWLRGW